MNKSLKIWILVLTAFLLAACSPVKTSITGQYKLTAYGVSPAAGKYSRHSILVSPPEAVAVYQTSSMLYTNKPFEISAFAHNAWKNPPADMLLPLITQSLQQSGYFHIVTSTTNSEPTDYRIDTQLLELHQNFLKCPSQIDLTVKVVLSNLNANRPVASRIMSYHIPCPADTPYGGVIAANQAVKRFTADLSRFVIRHAISR